MVKQCDCSIRVYRHFQPTHSHGSDASCKSFLEVSSNLFEETHPLILLIIFVTSDYSKINYACGYPIILELFLQN